MHNYTTHSTLEMCSCVSLGIAVGFMGSSAKPPGMTLAWGSILICVPAFVHKCVYCWFCCWQTNTALSAPVRADPLISMETRKQADINHESGGIWQQWCWDSSWLNPLVLLEVSVALQWHFVCFLFPVSVFGKYGKRHLRSRFPALKSDLNVFVSVWLSSANGDMIYTRSHTTHTRTLLAVSRADILMA